MIDNSDARFAVIYHDLLPYYDEIERRLEKIEKVVVNAQGAPRGFLPPTGKLELESSYGPGSDVSKPPMSYNPEDMMIIMHISVTTGLPKGSSIVTTTPP